MSTNLNLFVQRSLSLLLTVSSTLPSYIFLMSNVALAQTSAPPAQTSETESRWQFCQNKIAQQQYLAALSECQSAVQGFQKLGDRSQEAEALYQVATVYQEVSRFWDALDTYKKSLKLYQTLQDANGQAKALNGLGNTYRSSSQYEWAIDYYQQALSLYHSTDNLKGQATALMNLGTVYLSLSDYQVALNYSEDALSRFYAADDRSGQAQALMNLGNLYHALGQHHRAIKYYQDAMPIVLSMNDRKGEATGLMSLGNVYHTLLQHQRAIELYQKALPLFLSVNDIPGEAKTWLDLGNAYHALGQFQSALDSHQKALRLFRNVDNRNGEADALHGLGLVYSEQAQFQQAIDHFQKAIAIYQSVGDRYGKAIALGSLGEAYRKQGELGQANTYLQQSIELLESIRAKVKGDRNRVSLFETYRNPYVSLQRVLIAKNQPLQGLEVAERGRARAFVTLLSGQITNQPSSAGEPTNPISIAEIQQVAKEQNATLVEYSVIDDEALYIWVVKPSGEIAFAQTSLKDLNGEGLQSGLAALIDRSRAEDLEARGRGITFTEAPDSANLVADQVIPKQQDGHRHLKQLHQLLIDPIAQHLPSDPNQQVIFIPQGALFFVPFPALKTSEGQFLVEKHTITTAPAIQVLQFTRQQHQQLGHREWGVGSREQASGNRPLDCPPSSVTCNLPPNSFLIVGNPTMPEIGYPPQPLASLPGAEAEAKAIAKLLNTKPFLGSQATKATVVSQMQSARIIHLATHGLLDDYKGLGVPGALALAPDKQKTSREVRTIDGLLTAGEILSLRLQAELVVLSACDTGRGNITGDGVIGLSRSLILAGAPSVVVSLWKVPDDSTSELMQAFYKNLQQPGMDKAQALRQAMLSTKTQFPDPKDWAAFTLIGEAG